ncbi:protein kinase-like domain-containing protein [Artemisia annua]|uniref:Protein kinase-like domain-containing protein n=1 Tax=Artemisia annua TaxID=35608 RepID=A0A2U1NXD3_ARTAN|nr:protein kinase-like domain-containing protein [Artemisia annua]
MAELSEYPRRKSTVFIKSLDGRFGQRTEELLRTLPYVSHENLVKIFGFCDENDDLILVVYEYASNGSLDAYISRNDTRNSFPWVIRLQICLDAAHGLKFLHNDSGKHKGIIHGNIKSSNILINRDGAGMIGDFGLSTNERNDLPNHTRLTKEYDVYSFGLVLFEVMSGMLTHFKISKDDPQFLPEIVKRGFEQRNLNEIIDPRLKKEFEKARSFIIISERTGTESINIFARVAYQCFQEQPEDRPTMAAIVKELEKALQYHMDNLEHLKIPFKEIYSATHGFDNNHMIGAGGFGGVYTAELFHVDVRKYTELKKSQLESSLIERSGFPRRKGKVALKRLESMSGQGRREFLKEIDVLSGLYHQNLISLVGFCYEYGEMILVYDYASNGSFDRFIPNTKDNLILNWAQRLQICIDAAQGLNYLHNHHIIHRDVKSGNILLGGSLEGIIGDVGLSITINSADSQLIVNPVGTPGYIDPKYYTRGILTKQSDLYSFGVVLLEVLCGRFARPVRGKDRASLVDMAEHHLTDNQPYQIIAQYLMREVEDEKFKDSVKTYAAITRECLHSTETHCLTMADVLKQLNRALTIRLIGVENISLEEIMSATNCFSDERVIGKGPSGKIYKGELLLFKRYIPVAVKRLDKVGSYGEGAFLKEVVKLSHYSHDNIITIRGFCEEDNEKIIIMDHASNESLDRHLDKSILIWGIRLKISIGVAKGLNHIHSFEEDQKTLHGYIKSSNILLNHDWEATISNFIISKSHGTLGYLDPQSYSGMTKKSDVYSFGVVLFELLSGKLAIEKDEKYSHHTLRQIINDERQRYAGDGAGDKNVVFLAWMAARCFEENKLEALIFDDLMEQTDAKSIDVVSKVAYQCLHKDQEKRPTMALVIQELEKALNIHAALEESVGGLMNAESSVNQDQQSPSDFQEIMKRSQYDVPTMTKQELDKLLSTGVLIDNGEKFFSLSKANCKKCHMLPAKAVINKSPDAKFTESPSSAMSRFEEVVKLPRHKAFRIKCDIETELLSPDTAYACCLVFQLPENSEGLKCPVKVRDLLKKSNKETTIIYLKAPEPVDLYRDKRVPDRREDGWMEVRVWEFVYNNEIKDIPMELKLACLGGTMLGLTVCGIEFRPL